jgi:hypothetical protein
MGNSQLSHIFNCVNFFCRSWHAEHFCNLNLTFISYSFWNIRRKVLFFFYKFDDKRARTPKGEPLPTFFCRRGLQWRRLHLLIFFTEVIKFYWLMLLLYPGELYRLLGAFVFSSSSYTDIFAHKKFIQIQISHENVFTLFHMKWK